MWLAIDHQDDKVVEMVAALSGFFRTSLSHGEDKITIREELEHVENYLKIQQLRYGDIMEYSIDVPDEIKKNDIVKITLQPLVENALYHGLKKQREKGMIKISSVDDENNIFLIVEDNGVGMQPEQVVQINKEMYEDILTDQEESQINSDIENMQAYNRFRASETTKGRQRLLSKYGKDYFETNLQNLVIDYSYKNLQEEEMNKMLTRAKGILLQLKLTGVREDNSCLLYTSPSPRDCS